MLENVEKRIETLHYKRYSGIYMLYQKDQLIYVGVSNDIYNRLTQHRISKKIWNEVKFIEETDYYSAIQIENYFLEKYKPRLNISPGKLRHHESVNGKGAIYLKKNYPSGWK